MKHRILPRTEKTVLKATFNVGAVSVEHFQPTSNHHKFTVPLLFVHGMWCNGTMFSNMMESLCTLGYECYALSLRGHGKSTCEKNLGEVSIDDYIADVEQVLGHLGKEVVQIGHSMGGLIGSQVALRNSERIEAYVSLTSAPSRWMRMGSEPLFRMPRYLGRMLGYKPVGLIPGDARAMLFNTVSDDHAFNALYEQMGKESGKAAWEITWGKYKISRLDCPTLVIAGGQDAITPQQNGIARRLGADRPFIIPGYSHMDALLDPDGAVASNIDHWLQQVVPDGYVSRN